MGLFSNSSPNIHGGSLELFKPPLGIDPSYCVNQETTLIIKVSHAPSLSCTASMRRERRS